MVIKAFNKAFCNGENVALTIAGDGECKQELMSLCEALNEHRVNFIGRYTREDSPAIFASADSFVLTSQVEPFGIVYIEAMLAGLPCIGTKGQGADDIITDSNGLLVEYGDIDMLSKAMKKVYQKCWNHLLIQKECIQKFSDDSVCSRIEKIYEKVKRG